MTQAVYLGFFLLDHQLTPRPTRVDVMRAALLRSLPDLEVHGEVATGGALLTPDRTDGSARLPSLLIDGTWTTDREPVRVLIGHGGVAAVVVTREMDAHDVKATDAEVTATLEPLRARIATESHALVPYADARAWPEGAIGRGTFLWWHRVFVADGPGAALNPNLRFGVSIATHTGEAGLVASGFSLLYREHAGALNEVVQGLFAATEEWLDVDTVQRQVMTWVPAISESDAVLAEVPRHVNTTIAVLLTHRATLNERERYLRNYARATLDAARAAWHTSEQVAELEQTLASVRDLANAEAAQRQASRDRLRNDYLFAFTLLAVLQTVLAIFDFLTNDGQSVVSVIRLVFGGAVALAGMVLIARVTVRGRHKEE